MASARTPRSDSSPVWGDRGFHRPAPGESHATCKVCGQKMIYRSSKQDGTSHLKRHMGCRSCRRRAEAQQQQQEQQEEEEEVVAPPVIVAEPFQPSGQQVRHYSTTIVTDVGDAAELHPHMLLPPPYAAAPTAAAGSFQPGGQVCDAAAAFADPLHGHGSVVEGSGAYVASYSSISDVHHAAASSMSQPPDYFSDQDSDTIYNLLCDF